MRRIVIARIAIEKDERQALAETRKEIQERKALVSSAWFVGANDAAIQTQGHETKDDYRR